MAANSDAEVLAQAGDYILETLVCKCSLTSTCPRSVSLTPAASAFKPSVYGLRPTDTRQ